MNGQSQQSGYPSECRICKDGVIIDPSNHDHAFICQGPRQVIQGALTFSRNQLIGKHGPHFDPLFLKEGQIHADIIDNISQTATGDHQDRRIQQAGNPGV